MDYTDNKPELLYDDNNSDNKILYSDSKQVVYVNKMKACETSKLHLSYNIKKTEAIAKGFNRDRKDKDSDVFKEDIKKILTTIDIFDEDMSDNNFRKKLIKILGESTLKEFSSINVIRHIINQFNGTDKAISTWIYLE